MIKRILTLLLVILALNVYSQQEAQFSNYMLAPGAYNPGYLGLNDAICVSGINRQQWMGLEAKTPNGESYSINPKTSLLSVDAAIHPLYGGIGLNFKQDQVGAFTNTKVELGYAYHRNVGPGKLGVGFMAGFLDQSVDFSRFRATDPIANDKVLREGGEGETAIAFDLKLGGYYIVPDTWYAGISTSKLLESEVDLRGAGGYESLANTQLKRHYYLTGGYNYRLPHPDFKLEASALIKSDLAATQYDITTRVWYMNQFYGGLTYRPNDAASVLIGMKGWASAAGITGEGSMLGISYDITTSALGADGRSAGTFEVFLKYCFNIEIPKVMHGHEVVR